MNKKVLILSSSPRKDGNSETLAAAFAKGALEAGNQVETVHLREKNYGFCQGLPCLPEAGALRHQGRCCGGNRKNARRRRACVRHAGVLLQRQRQLKIMLDRANPLYDTDYAFTKAYLLATAAEDEPETVDGTQKAVQGWVDCFPCCELVDTIFAGGVNDVGDIAGHPALEKAYQAGNPCDSGIFPKNGRIPLTGNAAFEIDSLSERQARITGPRGSRPAQRRDGRWAHGRGCRKHSPDRSGGRTPRSWGRRRARRRCRSAAPDEPSCPSPQPSASGHRRRSDPAWRRGRSRRSWRRSRRPGTCLRRHG